VKDLLVVLPSRGRPHNLDRLWKAMQDTCEGDTTLLVGLDEDDSTRGQYPEGPQYEVLPGMRGEVTGWINALSVPRVNQYHYIGHFGDDCVPRTRGWDMQIMAALEDTPFAFGDDMEYNQRPKGSLATHVFMRSGVIRKLGYFGPPSIKHMYVDLAWMTWGHMAGITFLPDVQIEHMHFLEGKAPFDESYQLSRQGISEGHAALQYYVENKLERDIRRLCPGVKHFYPHQFYELHRSRGLGI
jgi:hypothetical protein